jgi:hypothetical protein
MYIHTYICINTHTHTHIVPPRGRAVAPPHTHNTTSVFTCTPLRYHTPAPATPGVTSPGVKGGVESDDDEEEELVQDRFVQDELVGAKAQGQQESASPQAVAGEHSGADTREVVRSERAARPLKYPEDGLDTHLNLQP